MHSFFFSRSFFFIFILFLSVIGFIFSFPTLVSTDWGKKQVVSWINHTIPGNVEIRSLKLQWGKGQVIEGVLLKDPEGQSVLGLEKFSTEATLWQLLKKSTHLGVTHFQEFNAAIVTDEKGESNLQRALGISTQADYPRLPPSTITLSDVNATFYLFADKRPLSAHMKGSTRQDSLLGSFEIDVALNGLYAQNWEKLTEDAQKYLSIEGSKEAKMHVKVINFPVDLIDRLVALKQPNLNAFFHALLGNRLNLTIDKEPSAEGLALHLTALAPLMQGEIKGKVTQGVFSLQEPATFHFNLKPELLNPFIHYRLELLEMTRLKLFLQEFTLPLAFLDSEAAVDPCQLGFKAQAELPSTHLEIPSVGEVKILTLKTLLEAPLCHKTISLQVIGQVQQDRDPFDIHFESLLTKPSNFHHLVEQLRMNMQSSLKISQFPLRLAPFLANYPSLIKQTGSHADVQLSLKQQAKAEDLTLSLSIYTSHIVLNQAQFKIGKDLSLAAPLTLSWTLDSHCLQNLLATEKAALEQPCPFLVTVHQLSIPLTEQGKGHIQLESTIKQIQLENLSTLGIVQLKDMTLKIEGRSLPELHAHLSSQLAFLKADGFYSPLLNRPVQFNLFSTLRFSEGRMDIPFIEMQMENPVYRAGFEGYLTADHLFTLTKPLKVHYLLTPEALQEIDLASGQDFVKLQAPTALDLVIHPTQIDFKTKIQKTLNLTGSFSLDHLLLQKVIGGMQPSLEQVVLDWSLNAPANALRLNLKGLTYADASYKPSHLQAQIHLERWLSPQDQIDFHHLKAEVTTHFLKFPTSFVNTFLTDIDLIPLVGPTLDIDLKTFMDCDQETPGYWDMYIDSALVHAKARIKIDEAITLHSSSSHSSAEMRWTLTPEGYHYLQKWLSPNSQTHLTLANSITLSGNFSSLYFPLKNFSSSKDKGSFAFQFHTNPIHLKEIPSSFKLDGAVESQDLTKELHFSLNTLSQHASSLAIKGVISHLLNPSGRPQKWQEATFQTNLKANQVPTQWIQTLLLLDDSSQNRLQALVGDHFDAQVNLQLQQLTGPLSAQLKGNNGQVSLDGQLTQGILTLRNSFEWQIRVTPQLNELLKDNMPLLSTIKTSDTPISLTIDSQGFSCPLFPFDFDQLAVEKGKIDLGKIEFRNEGELRSILSLIQSIPDNQLTIWFTPLYFQLHKGTLLLKRIDLLVANRYALASWGEIDLNAHKMNLILGLSSQSLQHAFNIQGLSDSYLLQIPIKGRKGSVEIDKKKAAGRISALIAQIHGDSKARLLGDVLEAAMSNHFDPTPPAPTTQPFPWAGEFTPTSSHPAESMTSPSDPPETSGEKKSSKKKRSLDPNAGNFLKELEQNASDLLKQWIK